MYTPRLSPTGIPLDRQGPLYTNYSLALTWEPKPCVACIGERNGDAVFLDAVEDPAVRPLLVASMPLHQFNCHATYYAGGDWKAWHDMMLFNIADCVHLVSDEPGKIYCIAAWKGLFLLFGRLDPLNPVWDRCHSAFRGLMAQF